MVDEQHVRELVAELRRGVPSTPASWSADDFQRFCENIARAIRHAYEQSAVESQQPEYGEDERPN